jgi:N-methylhydantoinase B
MSARCLGQRKPCPSAFRPSPNDVYLLNDPYRGGSHLPDLTVFVPMFAGTALVFWSVVRAHHSDNGGATHGAYNPAATEIWQEGLRLPPMRLTEGGVLREDLLEMLALNVRHPRDFRGDLAAQIGSARLGEQRLMSVIREFGPETLTASVEAMLDAAERHARQTVSGWADGVYFGEAVLDDDGFDRTNIVVRARVTKRGSELCVDLTESDQQVTGFINSSHANTRSAVTMAFAFLLDPDIAKNEGAFRPLTVKLKEGTIVWARECAPVTMCTSHCSNDIILAIIVRIGQGLPGLSDGRLGTPAAHSLKRDRPAHRSPFHLAHVPGPPRRGRIGRTRRVFHDRRVAFGRRDQVRQHRGGGDPFSAAVRDARVPIRIGRRWALSRRVWGRDASPC